MMIRPKVLGLITTYKCTASCDHCCFNCSPRRKKRIPAGRMAKLIDEAADIPTIELIAFTGGECFLLGDELDRLVARVHGRGIRTRCITNGYWASSPDKAAARIKRLVDSGLNEINLSTGGIHMNYVRPEKVALAARASADAGLSTLINMETFNETTMSTDAILKHPLIQDLISNNKIKTHISPWIMLDGKTTITNSPESSRFIKHNETGCSVCLDTIAVNPELDLLACCGFSVPRIPELTLGSVRSETIKDALDKAPNDFMKIWIRIDGPERIMEFVKKYVPEYELPTKAAHMCETCKYLYHDKTAKKIIGEHYKEIENRVMKLYCVDLTTKAVYEKGAHRCL